MNFSVNHKNASCFQCKSLFTENKMHFYDFIFPNRYLYSTVTLFARFLGLSTSSPFATDT